MKGRHASASRANSGADTETRRRAVPNVESPPAGSQRPSCTPAAAVEFTVMGAPVSKERPRFGRGRRTYTPARTLIYERAVRLSALSAGVRRASGPVAVELRLYLPDARARDVDNLAKSILDALNGVAYADDSQVCELRATKEIDRARPRVEVRIEALTHNG